MREIVLGTARAGTPFLLFPKKVLKKIEAEFRLGEKKKAAGWGSLEHFRTRFGEEEEICCIMLCIFNVCYMYCDVCPS